MPSFRYDRQTRIPQIGDQGQKKLHQASLAIVGLGALGSVSANLLVRAGIGLVRLIDRDFLEIGNLQRQVLFDEDDLKQNLPKAVAAERKLKKINSEIQIEAEATDLNVETIDELLEGIDLVIDGTDNFETRFLINDYSLRGKIPWIYGGAVGTEALTYVVLPHEGPCLRCLFEEAPRPGEFQTCDVAGILAPVAHWVASFQAMEALKILSGQKQAVDRRLWKADLWKKEFRALEVDSGLRGRLSENTSTSCSGCARGEYPYLSRERVSRTVSFCGRNTVQIFRHEKSPVNFENLAQKLSSVGSVQYNDYFLKASISPFEITVFPNGRAMIQGTNDASQAKSVYAKYIGG